MTVQVVAVGDLLFDVVAKVRTAMAPSSDTPAAISTHPGGAAATVARWLALAGSQVTLAARVGDDRAGRLLIDELRGTGVQARVTVDPVAPTGTVVVLVDVDGDRTMLTDRGANANLAAVDVSPLLRGPEGHLHLSGYTLLDQRSQPTGLHTLAAAYAAGWTVSVTAASAGPLGEVARDFLDWTAGAWLCLANLAEARALVGPAGDPTAVAAELAGHYGEAVVTCGPDGAVWCGPDRTPISAPARAAEAIDTTGAGDALAAGFLHARLSGADPRTALDAGLALAADAVQRPGGRPPRPPTEREP